MTKFIYEGECEFCESEGVLCEYDEYKICPACEDMERIEAEELTIVE